ncbi:MAG: hypothetical protein ACI9DQ_000447, partial [Glaciecola sp.]
MILSKANQYFAIEPTLWAHALMQYSGNGLR